MMPPRTVHNSLSNRSCVLVVCQLRQVVPAGVEVRALLRRCEGMRAESALAAALLTGAGACCPGSACHLPACMASVPACLSLTVHLPSMPAAGCALGACQWAGQGAINVTGGCSACPAGTKAKVRGHSVCPRVASRFFSFHQPAGEPIHLCCTRPSLGSADPGAVRGNLPLLLWQQALQG